MNKNFLDYVNSTIDKYNLFKQSDTLVIAYSGGKDSLFTILFGVCFRIAITNIYSKETNIIKKKEQ